MNAPEEPGRKTPVTEAAVPSELARAMELAADPFGIGQALAASARGWMRQPWELAQAWGALGSALAGVHANWWLEFGKQGPQPSVAADADARFSDPLWSLPPYALLRDLYLTYTHWLEESLLHAPGVDAETRRRAAFWARQWLNASAPGNFLAINPVALRKAVESGGETLVRGFGHFLEDLQAGDVSTVDARPFRVGGNVANTPGAVVFRNRLVEVIQYTATRARTRTVPIVLIAPWINKYYILDLAPAKSLVRHLVDQGFDVFVTSWKNPGAGDAGVTFDDYLTAGILPAFEVARDICRTPVVHAAGYCLGGTALATAMAWCNRGSEAVPVAHWTLLTTLTDFSRPGAIEVFLEARSLAYLDRLMARQGFLDSKDMGRAFRLLRSNSMIWQFAVQRYLYGERPPAFDVLFWNADSTRMPRAMHRYYLREFYLRNRLVERDGLTLAGRPIDLRRICQPLYMVGTEEDHVAPWEATFTLCGLIAAPVRYTLTTSGHILGIINPPSETSKRAYFTGTAGAEDPSQWRSRQQRIAGSWWEDWVHWLDERCRPWREAPGLGSARFPKLADAPGTYVFET